MAFALIIDAKKGELLLKKAARIQVRKMITDWQLSSFSRNYVPEWIIRIASGP